MNTFALDPNGTKWYRKNNLLHREDGPAVEYVNGDKEWYVDNKLHRLDGPAIEFADGRYEYWVNGRRHNTKGPAVNWTGGYVEYWIHGQQLTHESFVHYTEPTIISTLLEIVRQFESIEPGPNNTINKKVVMSVLNTQLELAKARL